MLNQFSIRRCITVNIRQRLAGCRWHTASAWECLSALKLSHPNSVAASAGTKRDKNILGSKAFWGTPTKAFGSFSCYCLKVVSVCCRPVLPSQVLADSQMVHGFAPSWARQMWTVCVSPRMGLGNTAAGWWSTGRQFIYLTKYFCKTKSTLFRINVSGRSFVLNKYRQKHVTAWYSEIWQCNNASADFADRIRRTVQKIIWNGSDRNLQTGLSELF